MKTKFDSYSTKPCRQIIEEKEKLTIKVKPGWRKGTKITFDGMGNETPGTYPSDIIFVVA